MRYKLNKSKFAEFIIGTLTMAGLAGLLVKFVYLWVMSI